MQIISSERLSEAAKRIYCFSVTQTSLCFRCPTTIVGMKIGSLHDENQGEEKGCST